MDRDYVNDLGRSERLEVETNSGIAAADSFHIDSAMCCWIDARFRRTDVSTSMLRSVSYTSHTAGFLEGAGLGAVLGYGLGAGSAALTVSGGIESRSIAITVLGILGGFIGLIVGGIVGGVRGDKITWRP